MIRVLRFEVSVLSSDMEVDSAKALPFIVLESELRRSHSCGSIVRMKIFFSVLSSNDGCGFVSVNVF